MKDGTDLWKWSAGDHCRAVYQDDGKEYEATIMSMVRWR